MSAHSGTSIETLCILAAIVWTAAVILYCLKGPEWLAAWAERREQRREDVATARALGAGLVRSQPRVVVRFDDYLRSCHDVEVDR